MKHTPKQSYTITCSSKFQLDVTNLAAREKLNIELLNIWEKRKQTIIFITHNIREAIFLSDQILVMESNPGKIKKILNVDFSRPRTDEIKKSQKFKDLELEGETLLKG